MKWIKVTDRLPQTNAIVLVEYKSRDFDLVKYAGADNWWRKNISRWLDEDDNEPLFTLAEMQQCWNTAIWQDHHNERGVSFAQYMKDNHNIEVPIPTST